MTSCFNSHFSCTPNWSNVFETNASGQQNFSERLVLEANFTNGTNALAGKGLKHGVGQDKALAASPAARNSAPLSFLTSRFIHLLLSPSPPSPFKSLATHAPPTADPALKCDLMACVSLSDMTLIDRTLNSQNLSGFSRPRLDLFL